MFGGSLAMAPDGSSLVTHMLVRALASIDQCSLPSDR